MLDSANHVLRLNRADVCGGDLAGQNRIFALGLERAAVARLAADQVDVAAQVHVHAVSPQFGSNHAAIFRSLVQVPTGGAGDGRRQGRCLAHRVAHPHAAIRQIEVRNAKLRHARHVTGAAPRHAGFRPNRSFAAIQELDLLVLAHLRNQLIRALVRGRRLNGHGHRVRNHAADRKHHRLRVAQSGISRHQRIHLVFADSPRREPGEQHLRGRAADSHRRRGDRFRERAIRRGGAGWRLIRHRSQPRAVDQHDCNPGACRIRGVNQMIGRIQNRARAGPLPVHTEDARRIWREIYRLRGAGLARQGCRQRGLRLAGQFPRYLQVHLAPRSVEQGGRDGAEIERKPTQAQRQRNVRRQGRRGQQKRTVNRCNAARCHRRSSNGTGGVQDSTGVNGRRGLRPRACEAGHQARAGAQDSLPRGHSLFSGSRRPLRSRTLTRSSPPARIRSPAFPGRWVSVRGIV